MTQQTENVAAARERPTEDLLDDIRKLVWLPQGVSPRDALSAVMCTFSRHTSGGEARHLFESLPNEVKPLLERCMLHREENAERFDRDELARRVAAHLRIGEAEAEIIIAAVLTAVSRRLPQQTVDHVSSQLPDTLRELWKVREAPPAAVESIAADIERQTKIPPNLELQAAVIEILCMLSRRLNLGEARHFIESLPVGLRRLCQRCLDGRGERPEIFDAVDFYSRIGSLLQLRFEEVDPLVRAVFRAVHRQVTPEVIHHVASQLPRDLADIWMHP